MSVKCESMAAGLQFFRHYTNVALGLLTALSFEGKRGGVAGGRLHENLPEAFTDELWQILFTHLFLCISADVDVTK